MSRAQVSNLLPATGVVAGMDAEADMDVEDVAARRADAAAMAVGAAGAGAAAVAAVAVVAAVVAVYGLAPSASANGWGFSLRRSLLHARSQNVNARTLTRCGPR
jgi:hypothetical protein